MQTMVLALIRSVDDDLRQTGFLDLLRNEELLKKAASGGELFDEICKTIRNGVEEDSSAAVLDLAVKVLVELTAIGTQCEVPLLELNEDFRPVERPEGSCFAMDFHQMPWENCLRMPSPKSIRVIESYLCGLQAKKQAHELIVIPRFIVSVIIGIAGSAQRFLEGAERTLIIDSCADLVNACKRKHMYPLELIEDEDGRQVVLREANHVEDIREMVAEMCSDEPTGDTSHGWPYFKFSIACLRDLNSAVSMINDSKYLLGILGKRFEPPSEITDPFSYSYPEWVAFRNELKQVDEHMRVGKLLAQQFIFDPSFKDLLVASVKRLIDAVAGCRATEELCDAYDSDLDYENSDWPDRSGEVAENELLEILGVLPPVRLAELSSELLPLLKPLIGETRLGRQLEAEFVPLLSASVSSTTTRESFTEEDRQAVNDNMNSLDSLKEKLEEVKQLAKADAPLEMRHVLLLTCIIKSKEEFVRVLEVGGGVQLKQDQALRPKVLAWTILLKVLHRDRRIFEFAVDEILEACYYSIGDDVHSSTYSFALDCLLLLFDEHRHIDPAEHPALQRLLEYMETITKSEELITEAERDAAMAARLKLTRSRSLQFQVWLNGFNYYY